MNHVIRIVLALSLALLVAGPGAAATPAAIELVETASGLSRPVAWVHAGDGSGRSFVALQQGRILVYDGSRIEDEPFLDISARVSCCGERGLLGLAFHPRFEENGFFFVNYTDTRGDTRIARFSLAAGSGRADPDSETEVLSFEQPFSNHNGGDLAFGPDGLLYIASGDGGSGGDPFDNAQALDTLLGKILRIDVDGLPYAIPPDNPFVGDPQALDEIWAYGLRNPWRMSFDRLTGDLFIGDVGQGDREEVNFQPAASAGGENYGWRRMEGSACFEPSSNCNDGSLVLPILEYGHDAGCSVTGGYRYRGAGSPALDGVYVFGDFCSGTIWGATPAGDGAWTMIELLPSGLSISSFGEDEAGELYVLDHRGSVFQIRSELIFADGFESGDTRRWRRRGKALEVGEPGLGGSRFALAVSPEMSSRGSFVRTREPRRSRSLVASFLLNANRVDIGDGKVDILALVGTGKRQHVKLALEQSGGRYRVGLYARGNEGDFELVGGARVGATRDVRLSVEWRRASGEETADGTVVLRKGKGVRASRTDLASGRLVVKELRAGLPNGSTRAAASGRLLLDDFRLAR